jgi:anti-sigma B factor antagonist
MLDSNEDREVVTLRSSAGLWESLGPCGFACVCHDAGDGTTGLAVSGELDLATAAELDQALRSAQQRSRVVTLDLRRLTFMDCTGLSVVLAAATRARERGDRFRLLRGPGPVERLFALTGTDCRLEPVAHETA